MTLPKNYKWKVTTMRTYKGGLYYRVALIWKFAKFLPGIPVAFDYVYADDEDTTVNCFDPNETIIEAVLRIKTEISNRIFRGGVVFD